MAAKPQRSIRFEDEAYNGVLRVRKQDETFTATVNRVLLVGIAAIEVETQAKHHVTQGETRSGYSGTHAKPSETQNENDATARYVRRLENENARLIAEHEADRAAIAEKDRQISEALTRTQDLAAQSNAVALAAQERKKIPAKATGGEIVVMGGEEIAQETTDEAPAQVESAEPVEQPKKRGFWSRFWG